MTLTCHVTKEWSNIMGGSPPWQVHGGLPPIGLSRDFTLGYYVIP